MNNILILALGNSLIKISLLNINENKTENTYLFATRNFNKWKSDIKNLLHSLNYKEALIGSVEISINKKIETLFPKKTKIYFIKNRGFSFLEFEKECDLKKDGIDILGFSHYLIGNSINSIGISFGTAIFSIIGKSKKIMGVSILPSVNKECQDIKTKNKLIKK